MVFANIGKWWNGKDNKYQSLFLSGNGLVWLSVAMIFFSMCNDWRAEDSTYSSENVTGFVFGCLFFGIGCTLTMFGLILLSYERHVKLLGIMTGLLFIGSIIIVCSMEGYIYISWDESDYDDENTSAIETLVSFCSFLVWITLSGISGMLTYRMWFLSEQGGKAIYQWEMDNDGVSLVGNESSPLLNKSTTAGVGGGGNTEVVELKEEEKGDAAGNSSNQNDKADNKNTRDREKKEFGSNEYDYIPTAYERSIRFSNSDFGCLCFVILLLPLMFFVISFLPSSYISYLPSTISYYAKYGGKSNDASSSDNWIIYVSINNGKSRMTIYIETLVYYVLCVLVCSASYLSRKSLWFRIEMRRLNFLPFNIGAVSQARSLLTGLTLACCVVWFFYFGILYNFDSADSNVTSTSFAGWIFRFARAVGKVSMLLLSLSILTIAGRTSDIWLSVFGMSYDNMIIFHKKLSIGFVWCSIGHIILFLIGWAAEGTFWSNLIFSKLPLKYASDNFTVSVMWYLFLFVFIPCLIIFPFAKSISGSQIIGGNGNGNGRYQIFYYGHSIGGILLTCVLLWHGTGSWYIVIPSILLYYFDFLIGFYKQTRQCHVQSLTLSKSLSKNLIELSIGFDEIFGDETKHNLGNNQLFEFGMFVYIKIWQVSRFEWQPFRIIACSSQNGIAKFLIWRNEQGGDGNLSLNWANKLHKLARSVDGNSEEMRKLDVSVCGPYGEPLIVDSYRKILLIAEEMGITSMIGFFAYMLEKAIAEATQVSVDLIFIANNPKIFLQFQEVFALYSKKFDGNSERLFDVRLFYRVSSSSDSSDDTITKIEEKVGLTLEEGTPDLVKELQYLEGTCFFFFIFCKRWHVSQYEYTRNICYYCVYCKIGLGTFTLIIVNGSESIIRQSERVAVRFGAHFRADRNNYM